MFLHFTEEPLGSAEVWQLPVVVASDITAGPWRAPSGKTVSRAATVQLYCSYSTSTVLYTAVWEVANCLRVDLRALTAGQLIVCIRSQMSPNADREYRLALGDPAIFASDHKSLVSSFSRTAAADITVCWLSRGSTLQQQVGEKINTERTFSLGPVLLRFHGFVFFKSTMAQRINGWILCTVQNGWSSSSLNISHIQNFIYFFN